MKKIALGLTLLLCHLPMYAQDTAATAKDRQYVTDQLRLSLYEGPNSQSKVLKLLVSGDALDVDEIRGPYAFVTTDEGAKGWVKRGFLVSQPTAAFQLRGEQRKNAELLEEIDKLSNSKVVIATYEKDMDAMSIKLGELESQQEQSVETIAVLEEELAIKQEQLDRKLQNREPAHEVLWRTLQAYWQILVPALLALLLLCFLLSKVIVEARIKSKFHGIKIW